MTANNPVTFVFFRFVVPSTVNELLIVVAPFSVVAPCTFSVLCRFVAPVTSSVPPRFVAPETVSEFAIVSEPSLTPIPTARLRVPSSLAKIIS